MAFIADKVGNLDDISLSTAINMLAKLPFNRSDGNSEELQETTEFKKLWQRIGETYYMLKWAINSNKT